MRAKAAPNRWSYYLNTGGRLTGCDGAKSEPAPPAVSAELSSSHQALHGHHIAHDRGFFTGSAAPDRRPSPRAMWFHASAPRPRATLLDSFPRTACLQWPPQPGIVFTLTGVVAGRVEEMPYQLRRGNPCSSMTAARSGSAGIHCLKLGGVGDNALASSSHGLVIASAARVSAEAAFSSGAKLTPGAPLPDRESGAAASGRAQL